MKKLLTLICLLACVLGLSACGEVNEFAADRQSALETEAVAAAKEFINLAESMAADSDSVKQLESFTGEELEYLFSNESTSGLKSLINGKSFTGTVDSFVKAKKTVGEIKAIGEATTSVDGSTIIVTVEIEGTLKPGVAEVVLTNDMFLVLQSASLSAKETTGDLMKKAGLNTLLGMGSVFVVLILICLIISCFSVIPKIQKAMAEKKTKNAAGIDNAVAQIVVQEETRDASDDLELVAVIAAAVAAYEGAASSDGYVVRSIRKIR